VTKLIPRPTLITLTTTKAKRRSPPEPTFKASSSDSLKRTRDGSQTRSQSPAKRTRDGQIIEMPSSDDVEEVGGDGEEVQELAEDGKLEKSYASIADV
jgi:hypothetical protein